MKSVLYFAYGSNLDRKQMRARCSDATPVGRAMLRGYRLAFAGASRRWDGAGVATLLPARGSNVSGVLYQMSEDSLATLDRIEGHPDFYIRCRVCVADEWSRKRFAQTYCLPAQAETVPSTRYLQKIRRAYERLGFCIAVLEDAVGSAA
jgi:gamma-glutamylcyclotransferase